MVLSDKMVQLGDRRFKLVEKKLKRRGNKITKIPDLYSSKFYLEKWGIDPNFKKYKIIVPDFFKEDSKKFFTLKTILAQHPWLKMRALIGANYRADLVFLKYSGAVKSPAEAYRMMGSERATAYRLWNSIALIEGLEKFVA